MKPAEGLKNRRDKGRGEVEREKQGREADPFQTVHRSEDASGVDVCVYMRRPVSSRLGNNTTEKPESPYHLF